MTHLDAKKKVFIGRISLLFAPSSATNHLVSHASCVNLRKSIHVGTVYTGKAAN